MHRFGHHWMHGPPPQWEYGHDWEPGMLLSVLNTLFWIALFIGLVWLLLRWIIPYILPTITDMFGGAPADPSPLEILRHRYAAGEIDGDTFEQMRQRLEAYYRRGGKGYPLDEKDYSYETRTGYRETFSSPAPPGEESAMMAEQERYPSETER